jgi:hypothetical protein
VNYTNVWSFREVMFAVRSQERNKMITMVGRRYLSCGAHTEKSDTSGMTFIAVAGPPSPTTRPAGRALESDNRCLSAIGTASTWRTDHAEKGVQAGWGSDSIAGLLSSSGGFVRSARTHKQ